MTFIRVLVRSGVPVLLNLQHVERIERDDDATACFILTNDQTLETITPFDQVESAIELSD